MFGIGTDDFAISLASIFLRLTGIWTSKNRLEQCSRTVATCFTIVMTSLCILMECLDVIRGDLDAAGLLYALITILCTTNDLFKVCVLVAYKKDFLDLLSHLRQHFLESQYDTNEKTILDACKRTCAIFIGSFTFFTHVTLIGYMLVPLFLSIGKNESDRLFPYALPESPLYTTPYYEIAYFVQAIITYEIGLCHFCVDNILCIMNLHVATQFRILQYRLSNLKSDNVDDDPVTRVPSAAENSYMTFKRCVQQHKMLIAYCNKLEEVFSLIVFSQIIIFSVLICVNGLQILVVKTYLTRYTALLLLVTFFVQLLMFTYSCDGLIQESLKVAPAVYSSPWAYLPMTIYGKMLRKDVVLVIMRSRVPCCLTAKGFFPISLETYTKVWTTAMSYFTLLRQTMDDFK
ncbi:odorant receptor 10-like [Lasioglossum baleicum]|uniref:odorant receptor 10-like n=1 Tax=Lasioglossum baleicum TaxID=434251 RepID=UPI003FCD1B10